MTRFLPTRLPLVTHDVLHGGMFASGNVRRACRAGACLAIVAGSGVAGAYSRRPVRDPVTGQQREARRTAPLPVVKGRFELQLDSLLAAMDTLSVRVDAGRTVEAQHAFRAARTSYKRVEGMLAYYAPDATTAIQGPLETAGEDDVQPRPYNTPGAFPAIESALFPRMADSLRPQLLSRLEAMHERVAILRSITASLEVDEAAVFDAARAEIARVCTLDIAGFDSDRQDDALLDAAAALDGVRSTLLVADTTEPEPVATRRRLVNDALRAAAEYLRSHADFETMDRLTFLSRYGNPAAFALAALRSALSVPASPSRPHLWRDEAASVYDSAAFDPTAYAGAYRLRPNVRAPIAALGARLFADPRLSGPRTRACSTCHVPTRAFTDGLPKRSSLIPGAPQPAGSTPARHTPTLLNAALQPAMFDDERARTLEQQVILVLANPDEMNSSIDTVVHRLAGDVSYRAAFAAAFGAQPERAVTPATVRVAMAAYERSLVALNSPFDRAVRGDSEAMSPAARRGFTVFMAKGRCGTCHFPPLFNGTQPPAFQTSDPEIIGIPEAPALQHARLDPDPGRGAIDQVRTHDFAFKVPTVRNIALTAPYMHNGAFRTLEDVVAFYNAGGATGVGIALPYQTLFDGSLDLTPAEQSELIAFMRALTDTNVALPAVSPGAR